MISDALQHVAGDGLLAGITEKPKHECLLTGNKYTKELDYDYPSLSELNYWLEKKQTTVIFGVPSEVQEFYKMLSKDQILLHSVTGLVNKGILILSIHYIEYMLKIFKRTKKQQR